MEMIMKKESIKAYSYRVSQASRTELIVIMYDMAVEYLQDCFICEGSTKRICDNDEFTTNIKLAKRVIDALINSLDMQYEISTQLFKSYSVMSSYLIKASSLKDGALIESVIRMLGMLRKSFYEISSQDNSGPVMKNVQQVYAGLTYSNAGSSNEFSNDPVKNRGFIV